MRKWCWQMRCTRTGHLLFRRHTHIHAPSPTHTVLCAQFLPQDKVVEFARMDSFELLVATQKALGDSHLYTTHQELIAERKAIKEKQQVCVCVCVCMCVYAHVCACARTCAGAVCGWVCAYHTPGAR